MDYIFSNKVKDMEGSAIREMLKYSQGKDLIPFSAGTPALETLPVKLIDYVIHDALENTPGLALQYGVTDGYKVLIERLTEKVKKMGIDTENNSVLVTSGGQQVIDLTSRVLLNEGDAVACEAPTFIGGLNTFRSYNANPIGITADETGMDLNELEDVLKKQKIKFVYTIPTFQNPMGVTMPLEKRKQLLELSEKYDFMILEDNPYGELRFAGEDVPTIKSLDKNGRVIYAGSFSKILSPGIRVGFAVAPKSVIAKMTVAKQVIDVHTPMLCQIVAAEFLAYYEYDKHIKSCSDLYREKCQLMLDCVDKYLPEYVTRTTPQGGLFLWCQINKDVDTKDIMKKGTEKGIAIVPGYTFMTDMTKKYNTFRLNYSIPTKEQIIKGIEILGDVIKSE